MCAHCLPSEPPFSFSLHGAGFYDLWGDYAEAEAAEGGRCPTLRALLELGGGSEAQGREALLVDRRTDVCLSELAETARRGAEGFGLSKPPEAR